MITLADQITEAQRALALRKRLYPGWVKRGTLTEGQATYYLKAMEAIVQTLAQLDLEQRQLPLFDTRPEEQALTRKPRRYARTVYDWQYRSMDHARHARHVSVPRRGRASLSGRV